MNVSTSNTAHLLWTGGWDSTFRLLDLLILQDRVVQPYYLIDGTRLSFGVEIRTLRTLRKMVFEKAPECKSRLLPTILRDVGDLRPNAAISEQYKRLKARQHLGYQYEWLANFADGASLYDLELSIHRDDKAHVFLEHFVTPETDGSDSYYRLQPDPPDPDLQLFKYFRFPLFDLTKLDMQQLARAYGFDTIMEHTWFCHKPLRNGKPCGTCNPCRYTREEGLSRRFSMLGQVRYMGYKLIPSPKIRMVVSKLIDLRQHTP